MTKYDWTGEPQDSDSKSDLKALRAIAERATPGPWVYFKRTVFNLGNSCTCAERFPGVGHEQTCDINDHVAVYVEPDNASHITTFNPKQVLELLDRIETEETVLGILEEVLDYHSDVVTTHHEKCYLWHVGCLAVKLEKLLKSAG